MYVTTTCNIQQPEKPVLWQKLGFMEGKDHTGCGVLLVIPPSQSIEDVSVFIHAGQPFDTLACPAILWSLEKGIY
jgi:hypothetical protein